MLRLPVKAEEIRYFLNRKGYNTGTLKNMSDKYLKARGKSTVTRNALMQLCANASGSTQKNIKDKCRAFFRTVNDI